MSEIPSVPTGAFILMLTLAGAPEAAVDRAEDAHAQAPDRAQLERHRWARVGLRGPLNPNTPEDIRQVAQALKDGRHQDRDVQARALPMIHWAIGSLADDDVKYNAHGAEHFLRLAGPLAVPFLEMIIVTGDMQQRSSAAFLLLGAQDVSDPQAVADALVQSMRDDRYGHPVANCSGAFRCLASSAELFEAAKPALLRALDDRDTQLQLNAAQLLCIHGARDRVDRVVEILAPMLDHDDHMGNAKSAIASLGLMGVPALSMLRDLQEDRDEQGRALTAGLIHSINGGALGEGDSLAYTPFNPTSLTHTPALEVGCISPLCAGPSDALWGECGMGPWSTSDWTRGGWWLWDWDEDQVDLSDVDDTMTWWLKRSPSRVARARLEAMLVALPELRWGRYRQLLRDRFELAAYLHQPEPWPAWAPAVP